MANVTVLIILIALLSYVLGMMVGANSCRKELAREHEIITNMYIKSANEVDKLKAKRREPVCADNNWHCTFPECRCKNE